MNYLRRRMLVRRPSVDIRVPEGHVKVRVPRDRPRAPAVVPPPAPITDGPLELVVWLGMLAVWRVPEPIEIPVAPSAD